MSILGGPVNNKKRRKHKTTLEKKIEKLKKPGKTYTKAQLLALKRKAQGKTVTETVADNKKSMRDRARARHEAFKAARKLKISERKKKKKKEEKKEYKPYEKIKFLK